MDREESTNSSEEVLDHSDQENNDLGVGRSYECVYCKRGFNTAQALGGHMNIHRKDRARNKPNSKQQHTPRPRLYHQIPSPGIPRFSPQDHPQPHLAYFQATSSDSTLYESTDHGRHQPSDPAVSPRDWRMGLSLDFAPAIDRRGMEQDKELDLELRLGYDS